MIKIKTILVPVDFSECSLNALKYAAGICRINNARLTILNVSDLNSIENKLHGNLSTEHLVGLLNSDEVLKNIKHEIIVQKGNVIKEVLRAQDEYNPALIVMGTQGAGSLNRKYFGTNTTTLITKAEVPVLAIPAGSSYNGIRKIVLATDEQHDNLTMIEPSMEMFRSFNPELMLLYVNADSDPSVETVNELSQIPGSVKKYVNYGNATMYVSSYKETNEGITNFVLKKKADLLIMITRQRSLFNNILNKSRTRKMAYDSPVPLLAVPNF